MLKFSLKQSFKTAGFFCLLQYIYDQIERNPCDIYFYRADPNLNEVIKPESFPGYFTTTYKNLILMLK